jgi:hypothetical protein
MACLHVVLCPPSRNQPQWIFFHQKKSMCVYKSGDVRTLCAALEKYIFWRVEFHYSNSVLSLLVSCKSSFQIARLKISSLPNVTLSSPIKIFTRHLQNWWNLCHSALLTLSFVSSNLSLVGACTPRAILLQWLPLIARLRPLHYRSTSLTGTVTIWLSLYHYHPHNFRYGSVVYEPVCP